jgi:multisubunit Na+/H+ antiporter MnhE subunit
MYKKLSQLSFVIGLFFTLVSLVLFGNALINNARTPINIYTAIVFLLFGILMIYLSNKEKNDE